MSTQAERLENQRLFELMGMLRPFYTGRDLVLWFHTPQSLLQGKKPIAMLRDEQQYEQVKAMVARLADGAFI